MSLSGKQQDFMRCLGMLLHYAYIELPHELEASPKIGFTGGDLWARTGHHPRSTHYKRLGIDLNLFVDDVYVESYEQEPDVWDSLGEFWERLDKRARWGGRFGDCNHFSFEHEGVI